MGICGTKTNIVQESKTDENREVRVELPKQKSFRKPKVAEPKPKPKKNEVVSDPLSDTMSDVSTGSTCSDVDFDQWRQEGRDVIPDDIDVKYAERSQKILIPITINDEEYQVREGITIFDAAQKCLDEKTQIPTLCYHPYLPCSRLYRGKCGICEVENVETGKLVRACRETVKEGMIIKTNTLKVEDNIRRILMSKLVTHVLACPNCPVKGSCAFEKLLQRYEVSFMSLDTEQKTKYLKTQEDILFHPVSPEEKVHNESLSYDHSKCLSCFRCLRICEYVQGRSKCSVASDTGNSKTGSVVFQDLEDYHENMFSSTDCIRCGMCSFVCPVGAITEYSHIEQVIKKLQTKDQERMTLVCQVAPSVRITLPEFFEFAPGTMSEKVLVAALKKLGFDYVFDTNFAADLCTYETAAEFLIRLQRGGPFPMYTSCCPAWVNLVEQVYPQLIPSLSTCKSPQAMMGAVIKQYWAKKMNLDKERVVVVSLMPCVGKKSEIIREDIKQDVDYVLSTRELGRLFRKVGVDLMGCRERSDFDSPLGEKSSCSELFGATGGVTENVIRTIQSMIAEKNGTAEEEEEEVEGEEEEEEKKRKKNENKVLYKKLRGLTAVKAGRVRVGEHNVKFNIVSGGLNIQKLLKKIQYDEESSIGGRDTKLLVECMACPGGCIGGGGNPKFIEMKRMGKRLKGVYNYVKKMEKRKKFVTADKSPALKKLYEEFFQEPGSSLSKIYLHAKFKNRKAIVVEEDEDDMW